MYTKRASGTDANKEGIMPRSIASRNGGRVTLALAAAMVAASLGVSTATGQSPAGPTGGPSGDPAGSPGVTVTLPAPEVTSLTIVTSVPEAATIMIKLADDLGLYQKYGIENVEILVLDSGTLLPLVSNQAQAALSSPNSTLLTVNTESPLVDVAVTNNRFLDVLLAGKEIRSADDLRGKNIAISAIGGQAHAEVLIALEGLGLTADDVNIIQVGGQSDRVAALISGAIDAIPVEGAVAEELAAEGYNVLIDLTESDVPFAVGSLEFTKSFVEQNPNTVLALLAANLEAMQIIAEDTETSARSLAEWAQIEHADAVAAIEGFQRVMQRDMRWTQEGYENALEIVVAQDPNLAGIDVTQAYTTEFLDRLKEMGFNDAIGVP
jgi:NitT/TauT family transport system substrate-binding protein